MGDVINLPISKAQATPEEALDIASRIGWDNVLIIGYLKDGGVFHWVTSKNTIGGTNFLCDVMKHEMICGNDKD